jgi:hypothetical protein
VIAWLAACADPRPAGGPEGAVRLHRDGDALQVEGGPSVPWAGLAASPTEADDPDLVQALSALAGRALWVDLPGDTPFWMVRKVVGSARAARAGEVFLAVGAAGFPVGDAPQYGLGDCGPDPVVATGVASLVTLSIQAERDRVWLRGGASFLPVIEGKGPVGGLEGCAAIACAAFSDAAERAACEAHAEAPGRVELAGPAGCLIDPGRPSADLAGWRTDVAAGARALALDRQPLLVVMPEARVRLDAIVAVGQGLVDAGVARPALGLAALVEGNDGPPTCEGGVGDAAGLRAAAARWAGAPR